jgi:hypothetical protein
MHLIETYWFIWLVSLLVFLGLGMFSSFRAVESMNISRGMGLAIIFVILGYGSGILLLISIILNIISYVK